MNKWTYTKPYGIHQTEVPGIYSAHTKSGKTIYCFSTSKESAELQLRNSISYSDQILSIGREMI